MNSFYSENIIINSELEKEALERHLKWGEEKEIIGKIEHRRWNAYMRSEGYIYSGSKDKISRNDLGKMHHDLVDYASLSEEDKEKDKHIGSK